MDPINYSTDVKSPFEQSMAGYQTGVKMQAETAALEKTQQANALAKQLQVDLNGLSKKPNPGASDYANMIVKYPQLSEHFKRGWEVLNGEQKQNQLTTATQVYAAVHAGRPDIAAKLLKEQAVALRNSGKEQEAKHMDTAAQFIEMDPATAKSTTGLMLSSLMGPDKFAETFTKLEKEGRDSALAPSQLTQSQEEARKKKSDADLAEITARYGERHAVVDLAKKGWDIKKIESDIDLGKVNAKINAMNAQSTRMNAVTNQGELKLKTDKAIRERDDKLRERIADVTQARNTIDNMLNTADQLLKHPGLGNARSPTMQRLPTVRQDTADFEALMENFDAQAFTSQIPAMKGMGALSDTEGKKLGAALQSFKLTQSEEQLSANIKEAQRLMLKARQNLVTKYGIPNTVPDTPAAIPSPHEVEGYLKKYGPRAPAAQSGVVTP